MSKSDRFGVDFHCRELKQKLVPLIESTDPTTDGLMTQAIKAAQRYSWDISVLLTDFMSENEVNADRDAVEECVSLLRQAAKKIEKKDFSPQRERYHYLLNRAYGLEFSLKACQQKKA